MFRSRRAKISAQNCDFFSLPNLLIVLATACYLLASNLIETVPIDQLDLSLSLSNDADQRQADIQQKMNRMMEQIMSDHVETDFIRSIRLMHEISEKLGAFIRAKKLDQIITSGQTNVISTWATSNGIQSQAITKELDFVVATFWAQLSPLMETILRNRPPNSGPRDLDFRCTMEKQELGHIMALSSGSSLYSIFMDTFLTELYIHCLYRKLALIKLSEVKPSSTLKEFVSIYLGVTAIPPNEVTTREEYESFMNQKLVEKARHFNLNGAFEKEGPLSRAALLVADRRSFLSSTPDAAQVNKIVEEFGNDCQAYIQHLISIWGDFDDYVSAISTATTDLKRLNQQVKLVAPQLAYGEVCGQLLALPR